MRVPGSSFGWNEALVFFDLSSVLESGYMDPIPCWRIQQEVSLG